MSKVIYNSNSPYSQTPQTSWYLGNFVRISVLPDSTDSYIQINQKYNNRPDLMSYDFYNTTEYDWVFMARNIDVIRDKIFDHVTGLWIWVPTLTRLQSL